MKTFTTIALFFVGIFSVSAQYFNGSERWHARIYGEIYTKNFYTISGQRIHYFDGQSNVNGKIYRNLRIDRRDTTYYYMSNAVFGSYEVDEFAGYLREEGKQVYMVYPGTNEEVLLYDFDLVVGDWVDFGGCYYEEYHEVSSISNITFNGQEKTVFHFDDLDFDLIEGIGWTEGPLDDGCQDSSLQFNELVCFQKDNSNFSFAENVDCALLTSTTALQKQTTALSVFPNPVHASFQIALAGGISSSYDVQLYDFTGKLVASWTGASNGQQFDIGHLGSGVYTLRSMIAGVEIGLVKVVKQ